MRPRRTFLKVAFTALTLIPLAACDDEPELAPPIPLSQTEAELFGRRFVGHSFGVGFGVTIPIGLGASSPARAIQTYQDELTSEDPCDEGGSVLSNVVVTATYDDVSEDIALDLEIVQTHQGCAISDEGLDTFVVNGSPSIVTDWSFAETSAGLFNTTGSMEGAVTFTSGDRTGTCDVDVAISGSGLPGEPIVISMEGSVCDAPFSETVSVPRS